jgi:uncharacterized protein
MKKTIFYLLSFSTLISCKTVNVTTKKFFEAPEFKVRLWETPNDKITNLSYATEHIKVADSINIETWIISTPKPDNCFFFFAPSQTPIAFCGEFMEKLATKMNARVIGIQYRGYNDSDGKPEFEDCFKDNEMIYAHYKKELTGYKTVNLIGLSVGTVFAPRLASLHPAEFNNIILMSTFSSAQSMLKIMKKGIPMLMKPFVKLNVQKNLYTLNNFESLKEYQNGLLVIHAKDDSNTPYQLATELIEKVTTKRKALITLEDGKHFAPLSKKHIDKIIENISNFTMK